jgi:hypothetical protein
MMCMVLSSPRAHESNSDSDPILVAGRDVKSEVFGNITGPPQVQVAQKDLE